MRSKVELGANCRQDNSDNAQYLDNLDNEIPHLGNLQYRAWDSDPGKQGRCRCTIFKANQVQAERSDHEPGYHLRSVAFVLHFNALHWHIQPFGQHGNDSLRRDNQPTCLTWCADGGQTGAGASFVE